MTLRNIYTMLTWVINIDVDRYGTIRIITTISQHLFSLLFTGETILQVLPLKNSGNILIV